MKSNRVQATTWPALLGLFRQGFKYLISLVPSYLPCESPAFSSMVDLWLEVNRQIAPSLAFTICAFLNQVHSNAAHSFPDQQASHVQHILFHEQHDLLPAIYLPLESTQNAMCLQGADW